MDYEKAYKEIFNKAETLYKMSVETHHKNTSMCLEELFPELAEDKDEELRQMLIKIVNITPATIASQNRKELLDWLEKHKYLSEKERDEMLNNIIQDAKAKLMLMPKQIDFLKTIRLQHQQYHWRPTEEHLKLLNKIFKYLWNDENVTADIQDGLGDFINELKEL